MSDECFCNRRAAVATLAGAGMALFGGVGAFAQSDPKSVRPQKDDVLVYADGAKANQPIMVTDLKVGSPQVTAWAIILTTAPAHIITISPTSA